MPDDRTGKAALVTSAGAAIIAAAALSKKPAPLGVISLDEVTLNLLIAIAQGVESLNQTVQNLISQVPGEPGQITIQGYPPNANDIEIARIDIAALNTAYRLPNIIVPDGFTLIIKAWPTNAGIVYVAKSAPSALNVAQVFPLLPNDFIGEAVTNADLFYISGTAVGDFISLFVGHRRGGG